MVFKYSGIDKSGKRVSGRVDAINLEDAKKRLRAREINYNSLKEAKTSFRDILKFKTTSSIKESDLATISRDLSIYLKSGISILNSIRLLKNQYEDNKKIYAFLESTSQQIEEGKSFFGALEAQNVLALPNFYKQTIKVSEERGILDIVLIRLANFIKDRERINKEIKGALAYPMFIIVVAIFALSFMISFVVPKISDMFVQLNQELPPITKFVIDVGELFSNNIYTMLILFLVIVGSYSLLYAKSAVFKYFIDSLTLKLPIFGKISETSELAKFSYIISLLLESGVTFVQSINLSAKTLKNSVLQKKFEDASSKVVEGTKFSQILAKDGVKINKSFVQAIAVGEETSKLNDVLKNLSDLYLEENKDKIALFLSLLEPALMLVVGGVIGFIIVSMLLPIFSMNLGGF